MTNTDTTTCGCGCGEMTTVTQAQACDCGCECCGAPATIDEEVAQLEELRKGIDRRLEELGAA